MVTTWRSSPAPYTLLALCTCKKCRYKSGFNSSCGALCTMAVPQVFGLVAKWKDSSLPLKSVSVEARVRGFVLGLSSTLTYSNDSSDPVEVLFRFPLEKSHAVVSLTALIHGRKIKANVREKEEARAQYDTRLRAVFRRLSRRKRAAMCSAWLSAIFLRARRHKSSFSLLGNWALTRREAFASLSPPLSSLATPPWAPLTHWHQSQEGRGTRWYLLCHGSP